MVPKLFQFENKDEAWYHAWAERDHGRVGLAFVYAAPIEESEQETDGLGSFNDVFGDIFGSAGNNSPAKAEEQPVDSPRKGYLLVCWPQGLGLTQQGHNAVTGKYAVVEFAQADRLILSLTDDAIEHAVELVVSGTAEHRGHMMPPKQPAAE
ncbi:hypothetical protein [Cupriavidus metallidurans]|uniref:hypothetical protein n=1 Tax=Cupriavidus metallidurans TaxID=119219 RepID=UPI001647D75A|nr:hypothetical protein [Cupriavidus metallidurans]